MPRLRTLYWCDFLVMLACNAAVAALVVALLIHGFKPATPTDPKIYVSPPEAFVGEWGSTVALAVAGLAFLILVRRYLWVKKVLSKGTLIKGIVRSVECRKRDANADRRGEALVRPRIVRNDYATIRYAAGGGEWEVNVGLPGSNTFFNVIAGHEVDLLVLDSAPTRPLVREVYLWQPAPLTLRSMFWPSRSPGPNTTSRR